MEATPLLDDLNEHLKQADAYGPDVRAAVQHVLLEEFATTQKHASPDWRYRSYQRLVLELGQARSAPVQTTTALGVMAERSCYSNCYSAALDDVALTYCEGYARTTFLVVRHAWLEREDGTIIDPTWVNLDLEPGMCATYVGVRFETEFLIQHTQRTGWFSFLENDWRFNNELLRRGLELNHLGRAYAMGPHTQETP